MKKFYAILCLAIASLTQLQAQAPQGFNYQATVRNSAGDLIVNTNVYFKFNIMQGSQTSLPVFTETHYVPTDDLGQVNIVIGEGTANTGTFSELDWSLGSYYLGIELDTGNGYVAMGTTQLLSVPYALYAENSGNAPPTTPNLQSVLTENNSAGQQQIKDLLEPTDGTDAVTKAYVDALSNTQGLMNFNGWDNYQVWNDGTSVQLTPNSFVFVNANDTTLIFPDGPENCCFGDVIYVYVMDGDPLTPLLFNLQANGFPIAVGGGDMPLEFTSSDIISGEFWSVGLNTIVNVGNYWMVAGFLGHIINDSDIDDDGDGYTENQGDCDDSNAQINPGATELEDGIDNDCDGEVDELPNSTIDITGFITSNTTWTSNNIYILNQKVVVQDGATLTIEPGTIIKGSSGTGSLASALVIARGGKLMAEGTASQPIIMTSASDDITVGQTMGSNLDQNDRGLWGGLIVLGNAPCSFSNDVAAIQIEGIPAEDEWGLYGGTDAADNSGVMKYISIRHGGALIGEGNEINGLTLGGVGLGTEIDNIEVVAVVDDGIEFFGGTVNASNLFVWAQGDDAIDIDQAYSGTIDNVVVHLGEASDHAFEIDGPEGSAAGSFTLQNASIFGNDVTSNGEYADYRKAATGVTKNIFAANFPAGKDVELDNNAVAQKFISGDLTFENWEVAGADNTIFVEKVGEFEVQIIDPSFTSQAASWTTTVSGQTNAGADTSAFSWTYSNAKAGFGY